MDKNYMNSLAKSIHEEDNRKWWYDEQGNFTPRSDDTLNMLIISELAEAMEGHRKNLQDDKLPHRKMLEVELADAVIRRLDKMVGCKEQEFVSDRESMTSFSDDCYKDVPGALYYLCKLITRNYSAEAFFYETLKLSETLGLDLMGAIEEKRAYNRIRKDHSLSERNKEHGKKY